MDRIEGEPGVGVIVGFDDRLPDDTSTRSPCPSLGPRRRNRLGPPFVVAGAPGVVLLPIVSDFLAVKVAFLSRRCLPIILG